MAAESYAIWLDDVSRADVPLVGGKNASLGEMVAALGRHGIRVPAGYATTAAAYRRFVAFNGLQDKIALNLTALANGAMTLAEAGRSIRSAFLAAEWPQDVAGSIATFYHELNRRGGGSELAVAVRSSATAEDLPEASFAGQHESFLNVRGLNALLDACRRCYASLFTDRAIVYRQVHGFDHFKLALSIGIQRMVRSDLAGSGVMFSIDTETGFDKVVLINAAWGLGENVVQGVVDPDEYQVFKPLLANPSLLPIVEKKCGGKEQKLVYADSANERSTRNVPTPLADRESFVLHDQEILTLARWACIVERHYGCPMDMEWAKDGETGDLYLVQARPETAHARREAAIFKSYRLISKGKKLAAGLSIGDAVVTGSVCLIEDPKHMGRFVDGSILVTKTTDPDWVPVMKRAAAIITDHGGRTSHAAIVSRELGLPAIVGAGDATRRLHDQQAVTVSCAEGDEGFVYEGCAEYEVSELDIGKIPVTRTQIMLNLANPAAAFRWWRLPSDGVGLARMEFVINNHVKIHPMALVRYYQLKDEAAKARIADMASGYDDKTEFFVERLARGLARLASSCYPRPIIVRMSDFKTNEYARLIGGAEFEPKEENPMIGFRGASRYYSPRYRDGFSLECRAVKRLRDDMGFDNVVVMIPFCRSIKEADQVLEVMAGNGLRRGEKSLQIYVMCEIPSNVVLAKAFADRFDGFSIGSNDLTQLALGVDRDSGDLAALFDEQDDTVKWLIARVISEAHAAGAKVGLCGQAPSDHPEFAEFLVRCGIDSISVTPDSFLAVKHHVAASEAEQKRLSSSAPGRSYERMRARVSP